MYWLFPLLTDINTEMWLHHKTHPPGCECGDHLPPSSPLGQGGFTQGTCITHACLSQAPQKPANNRLVPQLVQPSQQAVNEARPCCKEIWSQSPPFRDLHCFVKSLPQVSKILSLQWSARDIHTCLLSRHQIPV